MDSFSSGTLQMGLYRRLVSLYPAPFRERFGKDQLAVIQDMLREENTGSVVGQVKVAWVILIDLTGSILHENFSQWRSEMKASKIFQAFGIIALLAWVVYFGLSLTRPLLGFPKKDPTTFLLGDSYSGLASTLLELAVYLIPFFTLLVFLIPAVKVQFGASSGETMVIRLQKMGRAQAAFAIASLVVTLFWWGLLLLSHFGLV